MGIVTLSDREEISVFSIEKNEMIHRWSVQDVSDGDNISLTPLLDGEVLVKGHVAVRKLVLSNSGFIVAAIESIAPDLQSSSFFVASFTLSGTRTGVYKCSSSVTYLSCHQRGNVVIVGLADGAVDFLTSAAAELLYTFTPHLSCASCDDEGTPVNRSSGTEAITHVFADKSVVVVSSVSGDVFCRALPDFVKYEKYRTASSFTKLVNNPIQTVQQHAQTISDAASTLKVQIDETIGELKKVLMYYCIVSL
jgi:hypothetical protein